MAILADSRYTILNPKESEVDRIVCEELTNKFCDGYILVGEEETCLPTEYLKSEDAIKNFEVREDDVVVASYLKTGSTWTIEMVWLIVNNLDFKGAERPVDARFPMLELNIIFDWEKMGQETLQKVLYSDPMDALKEQKGQRCYKTHLPFYLLPRQISQGTKSPKMIYVTRNPKDTCVSYYHYGRTFHGWKTTLENFCKVFLANKAMFGSFWKHVLGYWKHRSSPNLLFISYEEMKQNLPSVIRKVAEFLNKDLNQEQVDLLAKHLSFESMKNNKAVNFEEVVESKKEINLVAEDGKFMRAGVVGKYKEEMSPETIRNFDLWIKQNIEGTDFESQYNYDL